MERIKVKMSIGISAVFVGENFQKLETGTKPP